jgi:hypothetical protein
MGSLNNKIWHISSFPFIWNEILWQNHNYSKFHSRYKSLFLKLISSLQKKVCTFVKNKYIYDFIIKLLISNQDPIGRFKVIL